MAEAPSLLLLFSFPQGFTKGFLLDTLLTLTWTETTGQQQQQAANCKLQHSNAQNKHEQTASGTLVLVSGEHNAA